jgi:phospholipid/cholesterol/gamma-HCH transport system substrate-binding protein
VRRVLVAIGVAGLLIGAFVALGAGGGGGDYQIRAIFDSAAFVVKGEDVKIAGVRVGSIASLSVTPDNQAAVVLNITEPGYQDFRKDATCRIRPQSLIGEQFVECAPTQPRGVGDPLPPELPTIDDGDGKGQHLLPVEQTGTSVALDLIGDINRLPVRQRLSLIINELGVGLAGRGEDLNDVIRRAAPALQETDKVLNLVAKQNKVLEQLAVDSDQILEPLAKERKHITGFAVQSTKVAAATVERQQALAENFRKLPTFLAELQPTMRRLGDLADQGTPVAADLRLGAQAINELIERTGPFSEAATPALTRLGAVGKQGIPALRASLPIVKDLRAFGTQIKPVARDLAQTLTSFRRNGGLRRIMDYIYFQVQAINGFDTFGHFLRAGLVVNTCSTYSTTPNSECLSKFINDTRRSAGTGATGDPVLDRTAAVLAGASAAEVLNAEKRKQIRRQVQRNLAKIKQPETSTDLMDFLFGGAEAR